MLDCPAHNHALSEPDDNETGRDDHQQNSKNGNDGFTDFCFTEKIMKPFLIFDCGLCFAKCGISLEVSAVLNKFSNSLI